MKSIKHLRQDLNLARVNYRHTKKIAAICYRNKCFSTWSKYMHQAKKRKQELAYCAWLLQLALDTKVSANRPNAAKVV